MPYTLLSTFSGGTCLYEITGLALYPGAHGYDKSDAVSCTVYLEVAMTPYPSLLPPHYS